MIIAVFFAALLILVPAASRRLEMAGYHGVAGPLFLGIGLTGGVAFIIVRLTLGRPQA
jgi:hypothetical protein